MSTESNITDLYIHKKMIQAKKMFMDSKIRKSGYNTYKKFKYYELDDIVPVAVNIMDELELDMKFDMSREEAVLHVTDIEHGGKLQYTFPLPPIKETGRNAIQDLGAYQTYARRYLYMQAFDIVEAESIDSTDKTNQKQRTKQEKKNNSKKEKDSSRKVEAEIVKDTKELDKGKQVYDKLSKQVYLDKKKCNPHANYPDYPVVCEAAVKEFGSNNISIEEYNAFNLYVTETLQNSKAEKT